VTQGVREHEWPGITGGELAGKVIGVYGMGKIGYTVIKRLAGFELSKVLYYDVVRSERAEQDFSAERVDLERAFAESDVVSIHAPLNPATRDSVGEKLLRMMKPTAVLVNTARAAIVQPDALRTALEGEWIRCAAFDGYYIEGPELMALSDDQDPYGLLRLRDRFFVTSHQGFNTQEAVRRASEMAADKLISFFGVSPRQMPSAC
jgi:D-3-phosphoglycerate dehydrogenase